MTTAINCDSSIPLVSTIWSKSDIWEHIKLRWGYGRSNSIVPPGIYAVGNPSTESDVFVSANYTLSFNHLRRALNGLNAYILVLDTKGVNVWCAAGKGTFGTSELVLRVNQHKLSTIVSHKRLIVPQLGATGISAHTVKKRVGFNVTYGPVRATDIKNFIANDYKATPEMRKVDFPFWERVKLIPVELFYAGKYLLIIPLAFLLLSGFSSEGFSIAKILSSGWYSTINLLAAYVSGSVLTPILLPYIPFRRFSLKGLAIGWLTIPVLALCGTLGVEIIEIIAWTLIIGSISSFLAMNFTGASTYTSLSGVNKEMKHSIPIQIGSAAIGLLLWIISLFV
jgi:acetyl-CoA decarbonylase/synthase complex subunit gamma